MLALTIMLLALALALFIVSAAALPPEDMALVSTSPLDCPAAARLRAGGSRAHSIPTRDGEERLLALASPEEVRAMRRAGCDITILDSDSSGAHYYLAYRIPKTGEPDWGEFGQLLFDDSRHLVFRADDLDEERLASLRGTGMPFHPMALGTTEALDALGGRQPALDRPDPAIQVMLDSVSSTLVYSYTGDFSGEWPVIMGGAPYTVATRHTHYGGSQGIQKATELAGERLEALGLDVEYHAWDSALYPNVIGEIQGPADGGQIYILGAHIDDLPSGPLAPGADDNASGTVAVLVAADILARYDWTCTLRFALWTGEEQGMLGSRAYAQRASSQGEEIAGVLNLDMIGWNTADHNPDIDLHARSSLTPTLGMAALFSDVVRSYELDLVPQIIPDGIDRSDHASFWNESYPALLAIEDLSDFNPRYHSPDDRIQYLDLEYYVEFVKASLATFAHLSGCLVRDRGYLPLVARQGNAYAPTQLHSSH